MRYSSKHESRSHRVPAVPAIHTFENPAAAATDLYRLRKNIDNMFLPVYFVPNGQYKKRATILDKGKKTRNHILKESRRLFTVNGFQRTSISKIIAETGVKKGNLYYYFSSKEELGIAVLLDAAEEFADILDQSLTGSDPIRKIIHSCQAIMELMQKTHFTGGCLFGNTALEMSGTNPRFGKILQNVFGHWVEKLQVELQRAKESGLLNSKLTVEVLAVSIVAILEGGIMLSRVYENQKALEQCILTIKNLLDPEQT